MSGNNANTATLPTQTGPAKAKASDAWVQRGGLRLNRRGDLFAAVGAMSIAADKAVYEAAAAKAKPGIDAADKVLVAPQPGAAVIAARQGFTDASNRLTASLTLPDYVAALTGVRDKETAATEVLKAQGRDDGAKLRGAQVATQAATYNAMKPELTEVKRTYLPDGGAERIRGQKLKSDAEFDDFVTKLGRLEKSKQGRKPTDAFPRKDALVIKDYCDDVVNTAQAYLAKAATLTPSDDIAKKSRYCQESLIAARHYGMAMDLDIAGEPTQNAPWDRETSMRMAGTRVALSYEQGMGDLSNTKEGGASGASGSYWVKSKSAGDIAGDLAGGEGGAKSKGKRDFIFKPAAQEIAPEGMASEQPGAGAVKEAFACSGAKLFAQQTGIDLGVPETSIAAIGQYAMRDGKPGDPPLVGSAQQVADVSGDLKKMPPDMFKKISAAEVQKIALIDIMSLNMDRHGGNLMVNARDPDNPRLVPIDHGGSMPSRADFPDAKTRMAGTLTDSASETTETINALLQIPSAYEKFDPATLAKLELLDPDAIETDMKAERDTMKTVHPGLNAGEVVGDDSLKMSRRAMMFLKIAARDLSPAEIQIAIGTRGEELFDATDLLFPGVAAQIIADVSAKKEGYQELFGLSGQQLYALTIWLGRNGWSEKMAMADPRRALALYKSDTRNPRKTPLDLPDATNAAVTDAMCQEVVAVFPTWDVTKASDATKKEYYAYLKRIEQLGGTNTMAEAVRRLGGIAPENPIDAVLMMQGWAALQTNDYADELANLKLDPRKRCRFIVEDLIKRKVRNLRNAQAPADAIVLTATLDPADGALKFAARLLNEADRDIAEFPGQAGAATMTGDVWALRTRLAQGPVANETPLDFANDVQAQARALADTAREATMMAVRPECDRLQREVDALHVPDDKQAAIEELGGQISRLAEDVSGRGNLYRVGARITEMEKSIAILQGMSVASRTTGANTGPTQPVTARPTGAAETTTLGVDRGQIGSAPLAAFDWTETSASAAKKMAVKSGLFKDQDTGMTAALKAIKAARETVVKMKGSLAADKKIAVLEKAVAAYGSFRIFAGGKFGALSRDELWEDYCHSISDMAGAEMTTLATRIASIKNGTGT